MAVSGTLERYRTISRLGSGGMATVVLAEDRVLGRQVALKRMTVAGDVRGLSRLRREALVGASLSHPNLVSIYDIVTAEDGDLVIVMEYVHGETLSDALNREGKLPTAEALRVLGNVATALDAIHSQGIVHRDVKPANILLGADGSVKLADLGIASVSDRTQITTAGTILGSFRYMAPEQLEDQSSSAAIDVYALSAVAFEVLSGRKARGEDNPLALAHAISTQPPPDLRQAWLDAPPGAAEVLRRGMSRDPAWRPASATQLIGRLRAALLPEPTVQAAAGVAPAPVAVPVPSAATTPAPVTVPVPSAATTPAPVTTPIPPAHVSVRPSSPPPAAVSPRSRPSAGATSGAAPTRSRHGLLAAALLAAVAAAVVLAVVLSGGRSQPNPPSTASVVHHSRPTVGRASTHAKKTGAAAAAGSTAASSPGTATAGTRNAAGSSGTPPGSTDNGTTSSGSQPATAPSTSGGAASPAAAPAGSPTSSVESFYTLAASHRYAEAWALADPTFQSQLGGYQSFQAGQAGDRSITFDSAKPVTQSSTAATIAVSTTSVRTDGTKHCAGTVDLQRASPSAGWLLHLIHINCS